MADQERQGVVRIDCAIRWPTNSLGSGTTTRLQISDHAFDGPPHPASSSMPPAGSHGWRGPASLALAVAGLRRLSPGPRTVPFRHKFGPTTAR
jgi:hypothetical protein